MDKSSDQLLSMVSIGGATDASEAPKRAAGAKRTALDRVVESPAEAPACVAVSDALGAHGEALRAQLAMDQCLFECEQHKLEKIAARAEAAAGAEGSLPTPEAPAASKKGKVTSDNYFAVLGEDEDAAMEPEAAESVAGLADVAAAAPTGGALAAAPPGELFDAAALPAAPTAEEALPRMTPERVALAAARLEAGSAYFAGAAAHPEADEHKAAARFMRLFGSLRMEYADYARPTLGLLAQCLEEQLSAARQSRLPLTSVADFASATGPTRAQVRVAAPSTAQAAAGPLKPTAAAAAKLAAPAAAVKPAPAAVAVPAAAVKPAAAAVAMPAAAVKPAAATASVTAKPATTTQAKHAAGVQATPSRIPSPRSAPMRPSPRAMGPPPSRYMKVDNHEAHKKNPRCPPTLMLWLLADGTPQLRSAQGVQLRPPEGWEEWNARRAAWRGVRRPYPPSSPQVPPTSQPNASVRAGGSIVGARSYAAAVGGNRATGGSDGAAAVQQRLAGLESTVSQQAEAFVVQLSSLQEAFRMQQEAFRQQQEFMTMQMSAMQHGFAQQQRWMMGAFDARSATAPPHAGHQPG